MWCVNEVKHSQWNRLLSVNLKVSLSPPAKQPEISQIQLLRLSPTPVPGGAPLPEAVDLAFGLFSIPAALVSTGKVCVSILDNFYLFRSFDFSHWQSGKVVVVVAHDVGRRVVVAGGVLAVVVVRAEVVPGNRLAPEVGVVAGR